MFQDFFSLIYPNLCISCTKPLHKSELGICAVCQFEFPKTDFHNDSFNPINKLFWGRTEVENAAAFYFFSKKSKVQNLIHQLKYDGKQEIGTILGELYGFELNNSEFSKIDFIVPVPLHPKKLKKRGFNQAESIANGLGNSMKKPVNTRVLYRNVENPTQTKKSKFQRWENVAEIFKTKGDYEFFDKHILLVDDVVTTGSTLEACANALLKIKGVKVSIVCLACPKF